jgi:hypothetical protein
MFSPVFRAKYPRGEPQRQGLKKRKEKKREERNQNPYHFLNGKIAQSNGAVRLIRLFKFLNSH